MKLWPHQREVIPALTNGNYMLAWEPGVGKTLPALFAAGRSSRRTLYLCPAPLRNQIATVARAHFPNWDTQVIQTGADPLRRDADLVVCSYDQASELARWKDLMQLEWANLILDEAHYCKNPGTKRTRAVYGARVNSKGALFRQADRVWPLTGTPILNDPTELWPHVSRLWPEALAGMDIKTANDWMRTFCIVKDTPYGPKVLGGRNLSSLKVLLHSRMSRRTLRDTHPDMPPLTVDTLDLPPEDIDERGLDQEAVDLLRTLLDQDDEWGADFGALETHLASLRRLWGVAKTPGVIDLVKTELLGGQEKVVVFYIHREVGNALMAGLNQFGPLRIDGDTQDKTKGVEWFNTISAHRVLLAQISAAGTGLDGIQHATNRAILAEFAWTPAVNQQAIARVSRAGQRLPVRASYVTLSGSLDDAIARTLARKDKIVREVLG